jgi:hypothetical protein
MKTLIIIITKMLSGKIGAQGDDVAGALVILGIVGFFLYLGILGIAKLLKKNGGKI